MSSHAVKEYTPLNIQTPPAAKPAARLIRSYTTATVVLAGFLVGWAAWWSWIRAPLPMYGSGVIPGSEPSSVSIILTADNGDMVGTSEGGELKALMTGITTTPYDAERLFCEEVLHGQLFGSAVMLVTTGIGHDRAALCLRSLLQQYRHVTKEIMFLGTGGFSPARGGIVNSVMVLHVFQKGARPSRCPLFGALLLSLLLARTRYQRNARAFLFFLFRLLAFSPLSQDDCNFVSPAATTEIVPLGSVCVSPMTTTWVRETLKRFTVRR